MIKKDLQILFRSPWFLAGLIIKIGLLFTPGGHQLMNLFIPFLDKAILNFGANPWSLSPVQDFPYGSFLFFILVIPKLIVYALFGASALGASVMSVLVIKGVLLCFDFFFLVVLRRFVDFSYSGLLKYYWLNPILIYISYIYGQLDIVVMSMTCLSILFLARDKILFSAVFFGLAVLSKFHVVALIPLCLAYLWVNYFVVDSIRKILTWIFIVAILGAIGFMPLILADKVAYVSTGSPEAFRVFSWQFQLSPAEALYVGVLLCVVLVGRLIMSTEISKLGLFLGSGAIMGLLVLITNPMPGWYFWVIPFLAVLYSQYRNLPRSLWAVFFLSYFTFFEFFPSVNAHGILRNLNLTVLQACLVGFLGILIYWVLPVESPISRRSKPNMIGLSGDSGSGKNHLALALEDLFGRGNCLTIAGDDYHRWERGHENWKSMTHLNPDANHLTELQNHAKKIRTGQAILLRHYDHATGKFTPAREVGPTKTIIFQGLHTLFSRSFREQMDLKVFLNPSEVVRKYWKTYRDVHERGHSIDKVLSSLERRETDSKLFISPQKEKSDWVIEYLSNQQVLQGVLGAKEVPGLYFRYELWNEPGLFEYAEFLRSQGLRISIGLAPDSFDRVVMTFESFNLSAFKVEETATLLFPRLRPILRSYKKPTWRANAEGIHQLTAVFLMNIKWGKDL